MERVAFFIVQKGVQYYLSDNVQPVALPITCDTSPPNVDTPLILI